MGQESKRPKPMQPVRIGEYSNRPIVIPLLLTCAVMVILGGCSLLGDTFRNEVKTEIISIERYDPVTGKPYKDAEIIDERPIKVRYIVDGKPVVKMEKRTGGFVNPAPLPKTETKAEVVPVPEK